MKILFNILCYLVASFAVAQNYREDLLAMNRNVMGRETYSLQLNYKLYADGNLARALQQREIKITRLGEKLHIKQSAGIEIIETRELQLLFDHDNKVFSSKKKSGEIEVASGKKEMMNLFGTYVDTLVNLFQSVKIISKDAFSVTYECQPKKNSEASMIWVEMDKKKKIFRSVTTQYKEKRKIKELDNKEHQITLKLEYRGFNTSPVLSPAVFDMQNYVVLRNREVTGPAKKYSNYTYLNATP